MSRPAPLWRVLPHADPDDGRWQDHPVWAEVVVRAGSAAEARLAAARVLDRPRAAPAGNGCPSHASGFADEKLYWVHRLGEEEVRAYGSGEGPVLAATLLRPGPAGPG